MLILRFEVLTAVRMTILFFWVLAPCRFAGRLLSLSAGFKWRCREIEGFI
jgi:hypothetical protein